MLFDFILKRAKPAPQEDFLVVHGRPVPLVMFRSARARRYLLGVRPDGSARLTIPRRGSLREGRQFAERNVEWLARQIERLAAHPAQPTAWCAGTEIMFRGGMVKLEAAVDGDRATVRCGGEIIPVPTPGRDLRPWIVRHLWRLAAREFPPVVFAFAAQHQLSVQRVAVRNQRTRWGSCSRRGTVSLNWRLIQTPQFVRDYIILHELMHLRQMNHSARYWREVEKVCPEYEIAERWLKENSALLK
jgi:predicted metal-dependent hydrolase